MIVTAKSLRVYTETIISKGDTTAQAAKRIKTCRLTKVRCVKKIVISGNVNAFVVAAAQFHCFTSLICIPTKRSSIVKLAKMTYMKLIHRKRLTKSKSFRDIDKKAFLLFNP